MPDDGISYEIQGLSDVQKMLDDLTTKAADRCIRKALKAGAEIEQAAIVERAPVKDTTGGMLPDGALKSDIVIKIKRDDDGVLNAVVGPDKLTAHVARWVEYGHRLVQGGRSKLIKSGKNAGKTVGPGKEVGMVEEHPFIRPAYEATRTEVANAICTTLATEVEKASQRKGNLK